MAKVENITIRDLVQHINDSYFLPDIQREYVWLSNLRERKIENLFDSIMKDYPIGTFLAWKRKKEEIRGENMQLYRFINRYDQSAPHNDKQDVQDIDHDSAMLLLDGQQRATSLYIGLCGSILARRQGQTQRAEIKPRHLYLNLYHKPDLSDTEDGYRFEFMEEERAAADKKGHWFRVARVLEEGFKRDIYANEHKLDAGARETLATLEDYIWKHSGIVVYYEEGRTLDQMLTIFTRVNSGGMQLSYSDLLMSVLTAYSTSDIREEVHRLVDGYKEQGFGAFSRDHLLRTLLFLNDFPTKLLVKNLNRKNIAVIESGWDNSIKAVQQALDLLSKFGFKNALSQGYVVAVLAYYLQRQRKQPSVKDERAMVRFVRLAEVSGYFSGSTDTLLGAVRGVLQKSEDFAAFNEGLARHESEPLYMTRKDVEELLKRKYGRPGTVAALQLMQPGLNYDDKKFHVDHIYPRSKFTASNRKLPEEYRTRGDYLFNLHLLEGSENGHKNDTDPDKWLKDYDRGDQQLKDSLLPGGVALTWENIQEFEEKRSQLIVDKICQTLGIEKGA